MNQIRENKNLIAQCVKKGGEISLRIMFGEESPQIHEKYSGVLNEGDIIFINSRRTDCDSVMSIHKKGSILSRYFMEFEKAGLNPFFSDEVMNEVNRIAANPGIDDVNLSDYTAFPFVTIDNDGSKDLDQAVFVSKNEGGYDIYYAIADASYYVKPGSALYNESIRRGASYYLPGFSVPMLPAELSEGIISLNEGVQRRALIFIIQINFSGEIVSSAVRRGRILSRAKLSYSGVQDFYSDRDTSPLDNREYTESLVYLQEAGRILAENGERRGVINFDRYENAISITGDGNSFSFVETERNDAGRWNEQVSLICNIAGAGMVAPDSKGSDIHIQPVFRVHEAPEESSLHRLERIIKSIVEIQSLDECWIWRRGEETPGEYLKRLPRSGESGRITEAIERQILITNQKSFFSENPGIHFALKVNLYGRFSSPMREIVGIYSHKELLEKIGLEKPSPDQDDLLIREQIINSANRAKEKQKSIDRFVNGLLLDSVFNRELELPPGERPIHTGTILGMKESKIYVLLDSPKLEIKVYNEDIVKVSGRELRYYDNEMEISGDLSGPVKYKSGQMIELRLLSFDEKGKWHFVPSGM